MSDSERGPLADLVESYMRERNLTPHQIRQNGGPHPNTLWLIRNGTTLHPEPRTLTSLARALATHPYSKRLDADAMTEMRHGLFAAAGYEDLDAVQAENLLEAALLDLFEDFTVAKVWLLFLQDQKAVGLAAVTDGMAAFRAAAERRQTTD